MVCVECKVPNPDENKYCGQCGALVGHTLAETIRREDLRGRGTIETEITEAVFERLVKWSKWLFSVLGIILALFGVLLGWKYTDFRHSVNAVQDQIQQSVNTGQQQIQQSVTSAEQEIDKARAPTAGMKQEVDELQTQIQHYKEVNQKIAGLQEDFKNLNDVIDIGKRKLKASSIETTGPGFPTLGFGPQLGCPASPPPPSTVAFCVEGSPPSLYEVTSTGQKRPIASLSPVGFQESSVGVKPTCTSTNRGTFYVEKGQAKVPDQPFLCMKKSDDTYAWFQMNTVGTR